MRFFVKGSGVLVNVNAALRVVTVSCMAFTAYGIICSPIFYRAWRRKKSDLL